MKLYMRNLIEFMSDLSENNNKIWFEEQKDRYVSVKRELECFVECFIQGIGSFDCRVKGLSVKDCTYRIYRDLRFSADKRPYKTHIGIFVSPNGKKSGYAGYYIHIQPDENLYMLCSGLYCPSKNIITSVRDEIMTNGEAFDMALKVCPDFQLDWSNAMKRIPIGYSANDKYADYYKLKDYIIVKKVDVDYVINTDFYDNVIGDFKRTLNFNEILNCCVDFAK